MRSGTSLAVPAGQVVTRLCPTQRCSMLVSPGFGLWPTLVPVATDRRQLQRGHLRSREKGRSIHAGLNRVRQTATSTSTWEGRLRRRSHPPRCSPGWTGVQTVAEVAARGLCSGNPVFQRRPSGARAGTPERLGPLHNATQRSRGSLGTEGHGPPAARMPRSPGEAGLPCAHLVLVTPRHSAPHGPSRCSRAGGLRPRLPRAVLLVNFSYRSLSSRRSPAALPTDPRGLVGADLPLPLDPPAPDSEALLFFRRETPVSHSVGGGPGRGCRKREGFSGVLTSVCVAVGT